MTLKNYIKWLQDNFPEDAIIVKGNSRAWFSERVENITKSWLEDSIYSFNPGEAQTQSGKPIDKTCVVLYDDCRADY